MPQLTAKIVLIAGLMAVLAAAAAGPALAQDEQSIAEIAAGNDNFTTLVAALDAADLSATFSSCEDDSLYTVLAPTDDAFAATLAALELDAAALLADTDLLTSILTYHVLEGEVDSATAKTLDGQSVATLQGEEISIAVDGDSVTIGSANPTPANVVAADVGACNGVIHVIDNVLVPPSVGEALGLTVSEDLSAEDPPAEEELAQTGGSSDLLAVMALAVLAGGAMVVASSRRSRITP